MSNDGSNSSSSSDAIRRRKERERRARRALERRREHAWAAETRQLVTPSSGRGATVEQLERLLALVIHVLLLELAAPAPKQGYLRAARQVLYDNGIVCDRTASAEELRERLAKLH